MAKFVGVVYDPPRNGFPHLAVIFNERDMSKPLMSVSANSLEQGEKMIGELAKGLVDLAAKDGHA